jgi:hypothetical protein
MTGPDVHTSTGYDELCGLVYPWDDPPTDRFLQSHATEDSWMDYVDWEMWDKDPWHQSGFRDICNSEDTQDMSLPEQTDRGKIVDENQEISSQVGNGGPDVAAANSLVGSQMIGGTAGHRAAQDRCRETRARNKAARKAEEVSKHTVIQVVRC